ncbi:unnamed protein product [Polarella glacialis]|uniref:Alpha-type protein kinase domain-containing protein n=1 Tax=Polarella glacialis TaxID=89957 RepID=A0A813EIA9_POLGL|nr:unnamed protein product [Polarella glacialis]
MTAHINQQVMAFGGMRLVYRMEDPEYPDWQYVAKRLRSTLFACKDDMAIFCKNTEVANSFRNTFRDCLWNAGLDPVSICFVHCYLYHFHDVGAGRDVFFIVEQYLAGNFVKYNGNNGYINTDLPHSEVMQAFSHFTFVKSRGQCMVVDLQGVYDEGFLLTDPQLHSDGRRFGKGDFGLQGMRLFFEHHVCGPTCEALGLRRRQDELLANLQLEKDWRCLICMDMPSKTVLNPCGHSVACQKCTLTLLEGRKPLCPVCKRPFQSYTQGLFSTSWVEPAKRQGRKT